MTCDRRRSNCRGAGLTRVPSGAIAILAVAPNVTTPSGQGIFAVTRAGVPSSIAGWDCPTMSAVAAEGPTRTT
jgi:hypothetical protein